MNVSLAGKPMKTCLRNANRALVYFFELKFRHGSLNNV